MSSTKRVIAVAITTVAIAVGSAGVSHAGTTTKKITKKTLITKSASINGIKNRMGKGGNPAAHLNSVLSGLVAQGTITQSQADAVSAAMAASHEAKKANRSARDAVVTSVLGIDAATLKSRLHSGETLAAIAGPNKQALIDALVAFETQNIDNAVTAGKLTAAKAVTKKSRLVARITASIESVRGPMGKGPRHGGPMMGAAPRIPAPMGNAA